MFKYFLKRLAQMLVTLFIVSILVFVLANFIGDPVNMLVSPKAPPEVREQVREELGLNRPILEQYVSFVTNAFKGDFGKSYIYKVDVLSLIAQRVPATLELVFVSVVLALVISIPLGVYAGAFPKRKSSTLVMGGSILGISLPSFFIGIMLIYIFSLKLHWFPSSGRGATAPFLGMNFSLFAPGGLKYIILPAFTLSVTNIASLVRLTRAGVMENMRQDYIKFARAKGVSTRKVLFGHALKNALIPVITVFGMQMIFQDPYASLNPRQKIMEILTDPMLFHKLCSSKAEAQEKAIHLLERVGLSSEQANRYPHQFSGGQRQRIGIARALAVEPKFIIADEPVSALDVSIQAQILNILMDLKDEFHFSYLFIAHDLSVVKHISDSLGVMYLGTIVERAPKRLLFSNPVHPYTKALFSSAPTIDEGNIAESQELRGEIPSPIHLPSGCPFHDRCPMACPDCAREVPELKEVEPGHFAACHLL